MANLFTIAAINSAHGRATGRSTPVSDGICENMGIVFACALVMLIIALPICLIGGIVCGVQDANSATPVQYEAIIQNVEEVEYSTNHSYYEMTLSTEENAESETHRITVEEFEQFDGHEGETIVINGTLCKNFVEGERVIKHTFSMK